jgi:D-tyrosyl-tRNA(Tyr) deacylase
MRTVVQRVSHGQVIVEDNCVAKIGKGVVILLGISPEDTNEQIEYLVRKISELRIFEDDKGKMNCSLLDINGEAIVVSQFTLFADTKKGRRPSFVKAAHPDIAEPLVIKFIEALNNNGIKTQSGVFGAHMHVDIHNDGPVTILIEK